MCFVSLMFYDGFIVQYELTYHVRVVDLYCSHGKLIQQREHYGDEV